MAASDPISKQIFFISKTLIAGLLVLSAVAIATTLLIRSTFVEYRGIAGTSLEVERIFKDVSDARIARLKWRLSPDEANIDAFHASLQDLKVAEAEMIENGGGNEVLLETFQGLAAELAEYKVQFNEALAARSAYDGVVQTIREAGLNGRKALTAIMTSAYDDGDTSAAYHAGRAQEALMLGSGPIDFLHAS